MSATANRRSLLALLGLAPIAATGSAGPARPAFGTFRPGFTQAATAEWISRSALDLSLPIDRAVPDDLRRMASQLDAPPAGDDHLGQAGRAIAALAIAFPAEIAAFRSFAPHLRRRLYAELLARESARLASVGDPANPTPEVEE